MQSRYLGTGAILCAKLLRRVDAELIDLLRSLEADEWEKPTVAGSWKVRDVAAHLLDTALRKLSLLRDGFQGEPAEIRSAQDLAELIHRLNREGFRFTAVSAPGCSAIGWSRCAHRAPTFTNR